MDSSYTPPRLETCSFRPVASDDDDDDDEGEFRRIACRDAVVREYLNNLPCVFEGDACPSHVDEDERVENEIAQLDRDGLKKRVGSETRRCNEALMELLEQEQQMSSTLAGMRHLESRLRDSEGVLSCCVSSYGRLTNALKNCVARRRMH
ncbi:hypothetical protein TcG_01525 [Trypanosoma cruzi]|nr:hypothetical protein TcBrA4_0127710 [Trypanosoma cruzi]RNF23568.1 hypothetical protein TcG_01525 [Trypanosoma cruzi]